MKGTTGNTLGCEEQLFRKPKDLLFQRSVQGQYNLEIDPVISNRREYQDSN